MKIAITKETLNSQLSNPEARFVPWFTIEYITDLDIQRPIRTDEHVARSAFNQRIHHLSSPITKRIRNRYGAIEV